ncbi:MAG: hypothetical protein HZB26_23500 [Candidatus Hydrogenedentes bacterium]|nr:hypothetical protein [Candidatus Hydrogenedentota bacterium]
MTLHSRIEPGIRPESVCKLFNTSAGSCGVLLCGGFPAAPLERGVAFRDTGAGRRVARLRTAVVVPLIAFASVWAYAAADTEVAKSPNTKTFVPPSSAPQYLFVFDNRVYFSADDGNHGRELWVTNGTVQGTTLASDVVPGPKSSDPRNFVGCGNRLLFNALALTSYGDLRELNAAEVDAKGAVRVVIPKNLEPRPINEKGPDPILMRATPSFVYLTAYSAKYGRELWRSDGTENGTRLIRDLWPGADSPSPGFQNSERVALSGAELYFLAFWRIVDGEGKGDAGLWKTDGTDAGTNFIRAADQESGSLYTFRGRVYFSSFDQDHGQELWVSDGTEAGTRLLVDINPGPAKSYPGYFHEFDGMLYFQATDRDHGEELWRTDGTPVGTMLFKDICPGPAGSRPGAFWDSGGRVFFVASDGVSGIELWVSDGAPQGTRLVKDIWPGLHDSRPYQLCDVNGTLFFSAPDGVHGEELWRSDGTEAGTYMVKDINSGPTSSEPYHLVNYNGILLFGAADAAHGRELWRSDGTEAGTTMVKDIFREPFVNPSSSPTHLTPAGDLLYFVMNDLQHGAELWATSDSVLAEDGRLVRDIFPGPASSSPEELTVVGSMLYFRADDGVHGTELWRSDGSEAGTFMVRDIEAGIESSGPREFTPFRDGLVFVANDGVEGEELWWADATGPRIIHDINPGPASSSPRDLRVWKDLVFFRANDGVHGEELWSTNGIGKNTRQIRDIVSVPFEGASLRELTPGRTELFFTADDRVHGRQLWQTDGSFDGTRPRLDFLPALTAFGGTSASVKGAPK